MFECGAFPNMRKLGYELLAFTFGNWNRESFPDTKVKEMKEFISKHPCIIFVSTGMGPSQDRMAITVHRSYSDYSKIIEEFKRDWGQYFSSLNSFIVSLQTDNILKDLSFKTLVDVLLAEKE
jgi:DNA-binding Lrp family transcriptional regulator